jgi:hypothetical protein
MPLDTLRVGVLLGAFRYITKSEDFTAENFAHDLLEEVTEEFLNVMSNMRNSAELWKQALDEDGSLRFYIA